MIYEKNNICHENMLLSNDLKKYYDNMKEKEIN